MAQQLHLLNAHWLRGLPSHCWIAENALDRALALRNRMTTSSDTLNSIHFSINQSINQSAFIFKVCLLNQAPS